MVNSGVGSFEERVGQVLTEAGFLTEEQLKSASEKGHESGTGLLQTLLSEGLVARETLVTVLSFQLKIPVVDLKSVRVDLDAVRLVPEEFARDREILPIGFDADGSLRIATLLPNDFQLSTRLSSMTGHQTKFALALSGDLVELIDRTYTTMPVDSPPGGTPASTQSRPALARNEPATGVIGQDISHLPATQAVEMITLQAVKRRASDVHLMPTSDSSRVLFRVDGVLQQAIVVPLTPNPPKEGVQRGPEETRKCSFASGIMVFERGNLPETRSTQQMLPLEHPDRIQIAFDDHRLVNNAGLLLPATLAQRVGLRELVDRYLDLGHAPGRANAGDKMLTLVASALAGGDCIDDADALRAGRTSSVLGCMVKAPSTLGTFLRSFRWGHVRQLDRVSRELLARAWAAGAGPGDGPLTIDLDSTICETYGLAKEGARHHGYTGKRGYHPLLAMAAGTGDVLMSRLREGRANTARGAAHFLRETVGRVRHAGAKGQLTVRADSGFYTHAVVAVCRKTKVRFSITIRQRASLRNLIEAIPEVDWTPIPYWMDGAADVAKAAYTPFRSKPDAAPVRLIVRRVKPTPGSQLALFASYSYHGFITDRDGDTLELEADHRRHAEVENAIRDLKYGVGLNHLPSGRFAANAAWLAVQVLAHNLARWAARIGLGEQLVTTKTLRRRFFSLAGRLTRSARRLTLHLPQGWPWAEQATLALARLRAIPLPA